MVRFVHAALLLAVLSMHPVFGQLPDLTKAADAVTDPAGAKPAADAATKPAADAVTKPAAAAVDPVVNATNATAPAPNATADKLAAAAAPANATATPNNGTLGAASVKPTTGGCVTQCRRREIRDLSSGERNAYFAAVKKLQEGPAPTKYDQLVKIHLDAADFSHNTPYFLPWHRGYLREYEKALQTVDPSVCVPYYNSAYDSQSAENSEVWGDDYFGGNGGSGGCVTSGTFGGWRPYYPQPHCLQRSWIYGDSLGAFYSIESLNQVVAQNDDYDSFRDNLEMVIHPLVHNALGGDMSEMYSSNDPTFWSHHAYIDYVWSQWQRRQGYAFSGSASTGDQCQGLPYKVSDVMDHTKLCYTYDDYAPDDSDQSVPAPTVPQPDKGQRPDKTDVQPIPDADDETRYSSRDRSNLNMIRYPDRVSDAWAAKNHYDVGKLRSYEDKHRATIKQCNQIEGYVSPCSLWKRPKLCTPLIKKKQKLYCDVPNYGRVNVDYSTDVDPYQAFSNVKKRVEYCTPDVELPADKYRDRLSQLVGKSAFDSMKEVLGEQDVSFARTVTEGAVKGVAMCLAAAVVPFVMQNAL